MAANGRKNQTNRTWVGLRTCTSSTHPKVPAYASNTSSPTTTHGRVSHPTNWTPTQKVLDGGRGLKSSTTGTRGLITNTGGIRTSRSAGGGGIETPTKPGVGCRGANGAHDPRDQSSRHQVGRYDNDDQQLRRTSGGTSQAGFNHGSRTMTPCTTRAGGRTSSSTTKRPAVRSRETRERASNTK